MPPSASDAGEARAARLATRVADVVARTDAFAAAHLDSEYAALCRQMAARLAALWRSPLERGEPRTWAAAIVYAMGWVNFLADPSQTPHLTTAELARLTSVGQSTLAAYLRTIRGTLDLVRLDPVWTRPSRLADNPLAWMIEVDGLIIDARDAPRSVQEAALRAGAIPFLPDVDASDADAPDDDAYDEEADADAVPNDRTSRDPALDGLWADARAALERASAEHASAPPEELDAQLATALGGVAASYNRRPQAELGGLSPEAAQRLLDADWESEESAVRLDDALPFDRLAGARTLHDARWVLDRLAAPDGVKATPKGNLPRAVVAAFVADAKVTDGAGSAPEDADDLGGLVRGQPNEEDVWRLHHARLLLELAGLLKRRRGVWSVTRHGGQLAAPERVGALFAALVRTHFRRFDLAYVDGIGPAPGFQYTVAYTLYQLGRIGSAWRTPAELADLVLLPSVRHEVPPRGPVGASYDPMALALDTRVLRPLAGFGLAEARETPREPGQWVAVVSYRTAALFDGLFRFEVASGG